MALFNNFPYTDLNDINLDYTLQKLESLYTRGEQLYSTLTTWQQATDAELEQWKAATESALALWKTQTENSINNKIQLLTAAINASFTELRTQLEAHIAEIETTAVNAASDASASATAAAGAASAASINNEQSKEWAIGETLEGDPVPDTNPPYENNAKYYADLLGQETAQIDTNTADITDLKSAIAYATNINPTDINIANAEANKQYSGNVNDQLSVITIGANYRGILPIIPGIFGTLTITAESGYRFSVRTVDIATNIVTADSSWKTGSFSIKTDPLHKYATLVSKSTESGDNLVYQDIIDNYSAKYENVIDQELANKIDAYTNVEYTIPNKRISTDGSVVTSNGSACTDFYPVHPGTKIISYINSFWYQGSAVMALLTFYDANQTLIPNTAITQIDGTTATTSVSGYVTTTAPSNAAYVRFSSQALEGRYNHVFDVENEWRYSFAELDNLVRDGSANQIFALTLGWTTATEIGDTIAWATSNVGRYSTRNPIVLPHGIYVFKTTNNYRVQLWTTDANNKILTKPTQGWTDRFRYDVTSDTYTFITYAAPTDSSSYTKDNVLANVSCTYYPLVTDQKYEIETATGYQYFGEKITLEPHSYKIYKGKITLPPVTNYVKQACAAYGNVIVQFYADNLARMYNINTGELIHEYTTETGHGASAQFSTEFLNDGDDYPLLYVSEELHQEYIQVIHLTNSTWEIIRKIPCVIPSHVALDNNSDRLLIVSYDQTTDPWTPTIKAYDLRYPTNTEGIFYTYPLVSEAVTVHPLVKQCCMCHNGLLFYLSSYPISTQYPNGTRIFVVNPYNGAIVTTLENFPSDLKGGAGIEVEGIVVYYDTDYKKYLMLLSEYSEKTWLIDFGT